VYPKAQAPKPPAHPHCRCVLSPRINIAPGTPYREDPEAGRAWLREQGTAEGAKVLGSRDKLAAVMGGKSLDEVINAGVPGVYRVKWVGEGYNQQMAYSEHGQSIVNGLIESASAASPVSGANGLFSLWDNQSKFNSHVGKRVRSGDVIDADDYAQRTFGVLASANRIVVVEPSDKNMRITGKVQVASDGWVVLLSERGRIVTSYPFDPAKTQFEQRHIDMGDTLHEHSIQQTDREVLARIFGLR
jgi:hypothetical protein